MSLDSNDIKFYVQEYGNANGIIGNVFTVKHSRLKRSRLCIALFMLSYFAYFMQLYTQEPHILWVVVFLLAIILVVRLSQKVTEEKLLVLPTIGLQIQTEYLLGTLVTEFMEITCVKDVVINEAIFPYKVMFCLCVLTGDEKSQEVKHIRPLFTHSWPKLETLKEIYRTIQIKLFKYQKKNTS